MTMKRYIRPLTDIHPASLAIPVMYSVWGEIGEEGQFANTRDFDEDDNHFNNHPKEDKNWDKF